MQTRAVAGRTSTLANSLPKRALSSEDFPDFTSPTTTKSNGSLISRRSACNVSSSSAGRCISEPSLIMQARPLSSSPLSCKYRSAIMPAKSLAWRGGRRCRSCTGGFRRWRRFWRERCLHRDQFRHGHELKSFGLELIQHARHRLNRAGMNVMRQNDGPGARIFDDAITDNVRSWPSPIQRIDIPKHNFVTELLVDPFFLPRCDRAIWRPEQRGALTNCAPNCVLSFAQLPTNSVVRHFSEARM